MKALLFSALLLLPLPARAEDVTVFAAASLRTALDLIAADWQADTGHRVVISYGGSSALAQQIEQGAPADLFFSAAVTWMDHLQAAGLIRYHRGHIAVLDRAGLERRCCECYGVVRREFDRLLPQAAAR